MPFGDTCRRHGQNVTLNAASHAGQFNCLVPGFGLILSFLSQLGHWISTLYGFSVILKNLEHAAHATSRGLSALPASTTTLQWGQGKVSEISASTVGWWEILHTAPQIKHVFSPKPCGSMWSQLGHSAAGGVCLDSTSGMSDMATPHRPDLSRGPKLVPDWRPKRSLNASTVSLSTSLARSIRVLSLCMPVPPTHIPFRMTSRALAS